MIGNPPAFNFDHVPIKANKSSVKVFQNAKQAFSLEYAIFDPKTVWIKMIPLPQGRFRRKGIERGMATIQQFATSLGLHPDYHHIGETPVQHILEILQTSFQLGSDGPKYYCGGIIGLKNGIERPITTDDGFSNDILEILTEFPKFAFVQLIFKPVELPKEYQPYNTQLNQPTQVRFDIQQMKVENRFNFNKKSIMEETGCFKFSPRILVVENSQEALESKLNRLSVLFTSNGLKVRVYPAFWHRFSSLKSICSKRKLISPIVLDGYSLMNFISLPQRQFSHDGYNLVPNKEDYILSSGISEVTPLQAINLGIPIISGKTADVPLLIDGKDLNRHIAVFGMTGEGKSRFVYGLIKEFLLKNVKFLIFDPKGEYLTPIQSFCKNLIYLKPGSTKFPWGINIFQIPKNEIGEDIIPVEDHIQFVVSLLENIFEDSDAISPQMRRLLHLAVIQTVKDQGDFRSFLMCLNSPKKLGMKGAYLENTAAGIMNRIEKLFFGNTGRCFTVHKTTFEVSNLLDQNVIIDLSAFESMEDQSGKQIFLNVVLQYIYYFARSFRAPFKEESLPKNIIVLDEIQKLIPTQRYKTRTPESMIAKGPWTLRAYDISMIFIGTDPIVDQPILTNAGILAVFFTKFDPYVISNLLGLPRNEYEQLRNLLKAKRGERRCILSINGRISLMKTHDHSVNVSSTEDITVLQNLPQQRRLRESYQKLVFNPVETTL
ncbi:MAG: ATP-binding protein [Promethearchaeota archaeon]